MDTPDTPLQSKYEEDLVDNDAIAVVDNADNESTDALEDAKNEASPNTNSFDTDDDSIIASSEANEECAETATCCVADQTADEATSLAQTTTDEAASAETTSVPSASPDTLNDATESAMPDTAAWDTERLKRMVVILKKKYENAAANLNAQIEEAQILKGQQVLLKQLLDEAQRDSEKARSDSERLQQQLSQRAEEAVTLEQLEQVRSEQLQMQSVLRTAQREKELAEELLQEERQQNTLHKARLERLGTAVKERDKRIADLHHFEYSYRKACEQKQLLENNLEQATNGCQTLSEREERLRCQLAENERQQQLLQEEVQRCQLQLQNARQQINNLEQHYSEQGQTLATARQQLASAEHAMTTAQHEQRQAYLQQVTAEDELKALQEQFKQLKTRTIHAQQELKLKDSSLLEAHQIIEQIKFDNQHLQRSLKESKQTIAALQRELAETQKTAAIWQSNATDTQQALIHSQEQHQLAQQRIVELDNLCAESARMHGQQIAELQNAAAWRQDASQKLADQEAKIEALDNESNELSAALQMALERASVAEITAGNDRTAAHELLQRCQEKYQAQVQQLKSELEAANNEVLCQNAELEIGAQVASAHAQLQACYQALEEQMKTALHTIQMLEEREHQYNAEIHQRDDDKHALLNELMQQQETFAALQHTLKQSEEAYQEKDNSLKLAQHHLAKKVKDYSILEDKHNDQQQVLHKLEWQITELNKNIEEQRQTLRQQEEQHVENKRQADTHIREWERKYFDKDEAWQHSEKRCQQEHHRSIELEKQLERCIQRLEKYMQLEMILKNLGLSALQTTQEPIETTLAPSALSSLLAPAPMEDTTIPPSSVTVADTMSAAPSSAVPPPIRQESLFENALALSKHKDHLFD
jgi:chromosome segregation ATPase